MFGTMHLAKCKTNPLISVLVHFVEKLTKSKKHHEQLLDEELMLEIERKLQKMAKLIQIRFEHAKIAVDLAFLSTTSTFNCNLVLC